MKIFIATGYARLDDLEGFNKTTSGFGYTVGNIAKTLAKKNSVYLLTQSSFTEEKNYENIHICKKKWRNILSSLSIRYLKYWYVDTKGASDFNERIRAFAYYMTGKYFEKLLKEIKPDIVNIRGIGLATKPFVYACQSLNIPFTVSLHGINSLNIDNGEDNDNPIYKLERDVILDLAMNKYPVSVISTGIKKWLLSDGSISNANLIEVVPNGTTIPDIDYTYYREVIRNYFSIREDEIVFICCSTISHNKNQMQIIRAFLCLPENEQAKMRFIFVGDGSEFELIKRTIEYNKIQDKFILTGRVKKEDVYKLYAASDINILTSLCEGFGNSFIEGFLLGKPSVSFSDLDAIEDVYSKNTMQLAYKRTDEDLANAIKEASNKKWNNVEIKEHGKEYSLDAMANKYEKFYNKCIEFFKGGIND